MEQPDGDRLVREHTIYAVVVGSRAFGLDTDASDADTRGVYVAPTEAFWSLAKPPTHIEGPEPEWFSWEVERFCELALKANLAQHVPGVRLVGELGEEGDPQPDEFLAERSLRDDEWMPP